jgi:ketopantoate reductase
LFATLSAIDIGPPEGEQTPLAKKAAALFAGAGLQASLHSDMVQYLWIQYAITGSLWAVLVNAGRFEAILNDRSRFRSAYGRARMLGGRKGSRSRALAVSRSSVVSDEFRLRRRVYMWVMAWAFRHDEYTKRCSAHAFGDPIEVRTFYDDLIATGRNLGVSMPVMESYAEGIRRFAITSLKTTALQGGTTRF